MQGRLFYTTFAVPIISKPLSKMKNLMLSAALAALTTLSLSAKPAQNLGPEDDCSPTARIVSSNQCSGLKTQLLQLGQDSKTYKLIFTQNFAQATKVRVYDAEGNLLHSRKTPSNLGAILKFNFQTLPEGNYHIEVENEDSVLRQDFSL